MAIEVNARAAAVCREWWYCRNGPDKLAEFLVFVGGLWSLRLFIELFRFACFLTGGTLRADGRGVYLPGIWGGVEEEAQRPFDR